MPFTDDGEYYWIGPSGHVYFGCSLYRVEALRNEERGSE